VSVWLQVVKHVQRIKQCDSGLNTQYLTLLTFSLVSCVCVAAGRETRAENKAV